MKKKTRENIFIIIIIVLGIFIALKLLEKTEEVKFIKDNDNLYDVAIKYIKDKNQNANKNKKYYKTFTYYEKFGIAQDSNYRYVYMWIVTDSCYIKNGEAVTNLGSSMPYKFIFEKKKDKVIKYIIPEDGRKYTPSIRRMFPKQITEKVLNYEYKSTKLEDETKEYCAKIEHAN